MDLRTRIFAAGDVASRFKFTHMSDATARIVIRNALFFGRDRMSALTVPWCTYTDPEVGHVGLNECEARERGIAVTTFVQELRDVDRAVLDSEVSGFVKVHVRQGGDQIVGATIVARHAGEMLSELTLAIARGVGLGALATVIHPYPTQAEAICDCARSRSGRDRHRNSSISDPSRGDQKSRRRVQSHPADATSKAIV